MRKLSDKSPTCSRCVRGVLTLVSTANISSGETRRLEISHDCRDSPDAAVVFPDPAVYRDHGRPGQDRHRAEEEGREAPAGEHYYSFSLKNVSKHPQPTLPLQL